MLALVLLPACGPSGIGLASVPERDARDDTAAPDDTGAPEDPPVVTEETAPPFDDAASNDWLFALDRVHDISITLPEASRASLLAAPYVWAEGDITIDGEAVPSVGVRLRGKIGSFRALTAKPKFKIAFNEFVEDQRFYGLEELSLNNSVVDCAYTKEVVGYRVYDALGVKSLRSSYARVTVDGADYGLYVVLETPNDRWLDRVYDAPDGNLYDGKYVWYGGYNYTLLDFGAGVDTLFQLEEGEDVAHADIAAVSAALVAHQGTPGFYAAMGEVVDWDAFHRLTAVDQLIGHNDGYSMNTNNYRVYFDPEDGKADLLPWDLDYTFLYDYQWGLSWGAANGNLTYACFADPTCAAAQRAVVAELLTTFESTDWVGLLDHVDGLTYAHTQDDPRRECLATDVQPNRDYVRAWLAGKPAELRAWWGI
jgi:hypothetical protein